MGWYILKRLIAGILSMIVLITVAFFMMHAMPGDPFSVDDNKKVDPAVLDRLRDKYGLTKPIGEQYLDYWGLLLRGDLGISLKPEKQDQTVNSIIAETFPLSAQIGAYAVILSLIVGIPLGILSALRRGKATDLSIMAFATIGISVPTFVIAILLMWLFSSRLGMQISHWEYDFQHYILPVVCLSLGPIAYIARQTRSSMLEALEQDYIRTARAKGVQEWKVIVKHALKNALTPVITYLGPLVAGLLTGSFIIENTFSVPGIGKYFVESVTGRDYSMIMGIVVFFGAFVVVCNLLSDILLAIIDPRVKLDR
ncbi:MAG: ABC transporter permease [Clostridia bacterium]|nr:ABC transporter permease [Clostridia bacterium]MBR4458611.1 ABC transporter permease [Clostridia bacterium]